MWLVGIGGILGAMTRFLLGRWISSKTSGVFPLGTWLINLTGSFMLGVLAVWHIRLVIPDWMWFLFGIGFLGAYTTFSTFGVETMELLQKKERKTAVIYVSTSVVLGVIFAVVGGVIASE